ncbi:hypothetical protein MNB_SV-6-583 [hydrothermal vent metagenome]|uniref:Uncharacterized protein n=1 Tax=hydrothermal vent metagenome TaxID=652676 RepID=A0A1W1CBY0_9ZZZZ
MKNLLILSLLFSITFATDWSREISDITKDATSLWSRATSSSADRDKNDTGQAVYSKKLREEHFDAIWEDVIEKLEKGLSINERMEAAPQSAIFGDDKVSIGREFDDLMDDIINLLLDDNLLNYKDKISKAESRIANLQKSILKYREKKIVAPRESHIKTTKAQYQEKIADAKREIERQESIILDTKLSMSKNFEELGIKLTPEQIDVLLARVDGDDIIQMTLVMDVLKQITTQLLGIMQESSEELTVAKKYYGMHMVLLELVVYIQDKFLHKIEREYLPQIDKIIAHTKSVLLRTKKRISKEDNIKRRNIYYQNYQSQQLTLKTAILYRKNLIDEIKQIKRAKAVSQKNLDLSKNTYETVTLSSDLFKVISSSQDMMKAVMKLQIPTIIPFENIQMKEKYKELTKEIQK